MVTGGVSACLPIAVSAWRFVGCSWIFFTTSMPLTTRANAAPPCPSSNRLPPKSSDGWSSRQMKKSERAVSAAGRARHRYRADDVLQPGDAGPFQRDRIEPFAPAFRVDAALDDRHRRLVGRRRRVVVGTGDAMEPAAIVELAVHVFEEVGRRDRRALHVHGDVDVPVRRLHPHEDLAVLRVLGGRADGAQGSEQQAEAGAGNHLHAQRLTDLGCRSAWQFLRTEQNMTTTFRLFVRGQGSCTEAAHADPNRGRTQSHRV